MEAFLRALLPQALPDTCSFEIHPFQGKDDLMAKLRSRLKGYANWLPDDWRIFVIVDRDNEDCGELKTRLEADARAAGLRTRPRSRSRWQLVNRIAIEELEAWYFGDWTAVCAAYPRVSANAVRQAGLRVPDAIRGGTWEAFERILQRHGYFKTGIAKMEAARSIGAHCDMERNSSQSFGIFCAALVEAAV